MKLSPKEKDVLESASKNHPIVVWLSLNRKWCWYQDIDRTFYRTPNQRTLNSLEDKGLLVKSGVSVNTKYAITEKGKSVLRENKK